MNRSPSYDAVVSDEVALFSLGVHNFIFPRLTVQFLMKRTDEGRWSV